MSSSELPPLRWPRFFLQADDALFVLNARRRVLAVNPAWEKLVGVPAKDVRGQPCRSERTQSSTPLTAVLAAMTPTESALAGDVATVRRRGWPGVPWVDVAFFPWTREGRPLAWVGRLRPVAAGVLAGRGVTLPEPAVALRHETTAEFRLDAWESDSPAGRLVLAQARLAVQAEVPVLLIGPAGCGKESLARAIHAAGPRREEFFVPLDGRRLPPGLIADTLLRPAVRSNTGVFYLRHPLEMRAEMATRLAEMLGDRSFTARLFVAVENDAEATRLPAELLARVAALTVRVPSLQDRKADWERIVADGLTRVARIVGRPLSLSPEADQTLRLYTWPGNLRELIATLRDAALRSSGDRIEIGDLPLSIRESPPPPEPRLPLDELLEKSERRLIALALEQAGGQKTKAAQILGIWRARLIRRMEQLGIGDREEGDGDAKS